MHLNQIPRLNILLLLSSVLSLIAAQSTTPAAIAQSSTFNSSFALNPQQIQEANLTDDEARTANTVINFERSQYAGGPTTEDSFYPPPSNDLNQLPGTLLRVEEYTNTTTYSLPPNLALSRILYTSANLNGSIVSASSFVLWPFAARSFPSRKSDGAPVVIWNHMTSGFFGPAAPSKHRVLWAGDNAPFALALAGYAVVAPDFAGLGVSNSSNGTLVPHQYLASSASAKDGIYAFRAARKAFPNRLGKNFAVMGQSQGGGVAWATAELFAKTPSLADGHVGTVAVSPTTSVFAAATPDYIAPFVGFGLSSIFPSFTLSEWLTPFGQGRANVFKEIQGGLATAFVLFTSQSRIAREDFQTSWYAKSYANLANVGDKSVFGHLLVIQGTQDPFISFQVTSAVVNSTCAKHPSNNIEYLISNGTGHVPTLDATRHIWMEWIADRFSGRPVRSRGCGQRRVLSSLLPLEQYQATGNSYVQWAGAGQYSYEVPLAA
ncbi:MAG: hypothetical protein Q9190_004008 [Brigantiaea leucoxantha]